MTGWNVLRWPGCAGALALGAVLVVGPITVAAAADALAPTDFAWRGNLVLPAGASLARVALPVDALLRLQGSAAQDVRVFNAAGEVVPFAVLRRSDVERDAALQRTRAYAAHGLFANTTPGKPAGGAVEVRVDASGATSAWVRWGDGAAQNVPAGAQALQAALFDLREEKASLAALEIAGSLPPNVLVNLELASSDNLRDWTTVAVKGPLFHFDGADAPHNTTLVLQQTLQPHGRYLRLRWSGQDGVTVTGITGQLAADRTQPAPLRAALPAGIADGKNSLSWSLPFATPITALHLQAVQDNTLVPVRIAGRMDAAQPWRNLASTVIYRLDSVGNGAGNTPVALPATSLRALRVEASNGLALPAGGLQATVEFAPVQLAFVASGAGPFTLAAGRVNTPAAAVDASLFGAVSPAKLAELPLATIDALQVDAADAPPQWAAAWLPTGVPWRSVLLWGVLLVGVLVLGGVAVSLMRQLKRKQD
ncbi:MAG: DUF3999 family protein [Rhodoferax sp.]|nr:DUF3999 family protein [Rhodoferax sp.]